MGSKIEVSEAEIQKVYHRDCILLAGFAIFMWCILSTILRQALQVAGDSTTRTIMLCGFACDDAFSKSCRCQGGRKSICDPGIYTGAGCSCAGSICNISCEKKQKRFKGNY